MTTRTALVALAASSLAIAPVASAVEGAPLPRRDGVVVAWQARTSTAIVVTGDQRVYAIHALRRVAPGRRVRVDGIKWGTPSPGIKWGAPGQGIKWGIRKAANGTFESRLTPLPGFATTMSLRGTVGRRFGSSGAIISVPGASVVVPFRGAVWLPGGKRTYGASELGQFGASVTVTLTRDAKGRIFGRRVVETAPPVVLGGVPIAGTVIGVDQPRRTLTVEAGNATFPLAITFAVPVGADIGLYPLGSYVAATVVQATPPDTSVAATALSLNATFGAADAPATSITVPAPNPAHVAAGADLLARWTAARDAGQIPNTGTFTSNKNRLDRIGFLIASGDKLKAIAELEQFDKKIQGAPAGEIDTAFRDAMLGLSAALRVQLAA